MMVVTVLRKAKHSETTILGVFNSIQEVEEAKDGNGRPYIPAGAKINLEYGRRCTIYGRPFRLAGGMTERFTYIVEVTTLEVNNH